VLVAVATVVVTVGVVRGGEIVGSRGGRPAAAPLVPPSVASATAAADATRDRARPADAAEALTIRRERLLAGDARPSDVTAERSPARTADAALAATLADRGTLVAAPRVTVTGARLVGAAQTPSAAASPQDAAQVDVTYQVGAAVLETASGDRVDVRAVPRRTDRLWLMWTTQGWRVEAVDAPGAVSQDAAAALTR
jgi:hypothetical protein